MRRDGRAIILITHNMDHVVEVSDRVIVMREAEKWAIL
jgi:ABC-type sugar transport system ATPase subunit